LRDLQRRGGAVLEETGHVLRETRDEIGVALVAGRVSAQKKAQRIREAATS
jgi:hypothetical protein